MTILMSELREGQSGRVLNVKTGATLRERLLDLGLVPGTNIKHVMASPAGDPVCYKVRGAMIALRSGDANQVMLSV